MLGAAVPSGCAVIISRGSEQEGDLAELWQERTGFAGLAKKNC